ncbi:wall-associated receptor kinase 2-like [Durio zibethinus]|uniref:Wall-associated receptor kinase 2-like n=1 Tax=Durio zibethinus TaxID=66656 RepID=A0A6P6AH57_DURZI|nr:wall-associated receptor kinase 2-like [Durio zibethinus]
MFSLKHPLPKLQWLVLATSMVSAVVAVEEQPKAPKHCSSSCGHLKIPYPFGVEKGSYLKGFRITCNTSQNPAKAFLDATKYEVVNISLAENRVRVRNSVPASVTHTCLALNGSETHGQTTMINLTDTPFALSQNKFVVTGCNSLGIIKLGKRELLTGCLSLCHVKREDKTNGSCSGIGCCEVPITDRLKIVETIVSNIFNESKIKEVLNETKISMPYRCGSAFLVDQHNYSFEASDLDDEHKIFTKIQHSTVVLDWTVSNHTCKEAKRDSNTYACKGNSDCVDYKVKDSQGYSCSCKKGYQGNPYCSPGCQDIDECINNPCEGNHKCINTPGSYHCKQFLSQLLLLVLAFVSVLVLLPLVFSTYFFLKRRRLIKLREKFFLENGGLLLQQKNSSGQSAVETTKIFTAKELAKATDNYSKSRILGEGGNGTVYKAIIGDNQIVAVKKSKIETRSQIEQFINEVVVVSQINHRNVVKLLGCCLETEVPLLVYEFVPNGSLHYHIHNSEKAGAISWDIRLRIATETASALAYLHSAASIPIIHRDVKSANILLDENYIAKVSDFGASRLIPIDKTQITTLVQGTFGYLDPQYFQTSKLTEKSDVYSYGVVLVELLTGEIPVSFARPEPERNLSSYFILSMQQDRLLQILEPELANEENREELIAVAHLAMRCLMLRADERPSMKEVLIELIELRKLEKHPWGQANCGQALSLLHEQAELYRLTVHHQILNTVAHQQTCHFH